MNLLAPFACCALLLLSGCAPQQGAGLPGQALPPPLLATTPDASPVTPDQASLEQSRATMCDAFAGAMRTATLALRQGLLETADVLAVDQARAVIQPYCLYPPKPITSASLLQTVQQALWNLQAVATRAAAAQPRPPAPRPARTTS